ncbi:hypothetical protein GOBAR_DD10204 [Gossypium barbadense]|nr:hypothetical protein GOBAR_DD10204 [Gossypium barbadense]
MNQRRRNDLRNGDDGYNNNGPSDHEFKDYSDPNLDEVSDDINDEDANNDGNVNVSSVENLSRGIMIYNDLGAHMLSVDPDVMYSSKFPEYLDILPAHWLTVEPECQKKSIIGGYVLQADNFDAKNEAETSKPDGGGTSVCQGVQEHNRCEPSEIKVNECRNIFLTVRNFLSNGVLNRRPGIPPRSYRVDLQNRRRD